MADDYHVGDDTSDTDSSSLTAPAEYHAGAPPDAPVDDRGFLERAWDNIKTNLATAGKPAIAGPVNAPLLEGVARGVRDVGDTGAEGLAWTANKLAPPGVTVDVDALRQANKADRDAWEQAHADSTQASIGRVGGQTLATLPLIGGAGALVGRAAAAIPGAAGKVAQAIAALQPAEGTIARGAQLAGQGATTGATQAALTSSASDQPVSDQIATGAITGGVAGPMLGGVTKAIDTLRGYAGGVQPAIAALADRARQMGIDVPITAMSSNPVLRIMADTLNKLPLSGVGASDLATHRAVQGALAREMGGSADTFGPAEWTGIKKNISDGFTNVTNQVPQVTGGNTLAGDLAAVGTDATRFLDPDTVGHVGRAIREVGDAFKGGPITPQQYLSLTASDGPLAKIADAAPSAAQPYLSRIGQAVEDRLVASSPTPDIADQLRNLRYQYRIMKTVEPLVDKSTTGDISLGGLQQQVLNQQRKYGSLAGGKTGTVGGLADIGKQFFGAMPESGTAPRAAAISLAEHPLSGAALLPFGVANRYLQQYLRSPTVSGRLIDTSLGGATPNIGRAIPYGLLGPIDAVRGESQ
jgi:hypothetical protein